MCRNLTLNIIVAGALFASVFSAGAENSDISRQEKISAMCMSQSIFQQYAASAGLNYIDPSTPAEEVLLRTGSYSTESPVYKAQKENAVNQGIKLMLNEKQVMNVIRYYYENRDEAMLSQGEEASSVFQQLCVVNPKRYLPSYNTLKAAGKI
ncbi:MULTISPECIES: hypothetical protein [Photorhabdus]|uniref:hypothetical protein n=1 Tax=Photorhabdus TaxID=29487 RepID=UPI000DCB1897|nr:MULTISPECIES: hypothetical protein [Photorhabdus]MCT8341936.1 hypothetical protein [Photorhabdus kleinii]RAW93353.1 hypothetical protein CKY03_21980 [Photorhabdus sp. S9-53]RAW93751.1 hypothetical protein CKY05_22040 [Photorhabdus sp. S10-54]RAW97092.1 hypothetical protein CKY04_21940 [Photorhabdus sp. S8-52]